MPKKPIFVYDLDGTIYPGSFFSNTKGAEIFEQQEKLFEIGEKFFYDGTEIIELPGKCYILDIEKDGDDPQIIKQNRTNLTNLRNSLVHMNKFSKKKFEHYIATYNLNEVNEKDFIFNLFDRLATGCSNPKINITIENPIKKENVFDFVTHPTRQKEDSQNRDWAHMEKYGKNIHIVMAIINEIEKEKKSEPHSLAIKYNYAIKFVNALEEDKEKIPLLKEIKSKLSNVYFFDDDENNIKLAKDLGVNAYLVDHLEDNMTLHARLLEANEKIETLQKASENQVITSPTKAQTSLFAPSSPNKRKREETNEEQNLIKRRNLSTDFDQTANNNQLLTLS